MDQPQGEALIYTAVYSLNLDLWIYIKLMLIVGTTGIHTQFMSENIREKFRF